MNKMMKTKTLVKGMALTGALLASASVAKANAYLELISGSSVKIVSAANLGADSIDFVGSIGGWTIDVATGIGAGGGGLTVNLDDNGSAPKGADGLEVIYSSGGDAIYSVKGPYVLSASESGTTDGSTFNGYKSGSLWTHASGLGNFGTSLGPAIHLPGGPIGPDTGSINMTDGFINEVMVIGNPSVANSKAETINVTESLIVTSVPDGGMTASMVGCALLGLVGFRSKFGGKRS